MVKKSALIQFLILLLVFALALPAMGQPFLPILPINSVDNGNYTVIFDNINATNNNQVKITMDLTPADTSTKNSYSKKTFAFYDQPRGARLDLLLIGFESSNKVVVRIRNDQIIAVGLTPKPV